MRELGVPELGRFEGFEIRRIYQNSNGNSKIEI